MGYALAQVADELGCSERTLRRCAHDGLLRARAITLNGIELADGERRYASEHWELLSRLRRALRTERDVRLAVLFGSVAVGQDLPGSDVDLLVARHSHSSRLRAALSLRLSRVVGRSVHVVDLHQAETSHALLFDVLSEGRPVLDRDGMWSALLSRVDKVRAEAESEDRMLLAEAQKAVLAARSRGG